MTIEMTFTVVNHTYSKRAGKDAVYKVNLKTNEGDSLTIIGDSSSIYEGYPIDETVTVKIVKAQKTLEDVP